MGRGVGQSLLTVQMAQVVSEAETPTRGQQVKQVVNGVQEVTCDGPGFPATGGSGEGLQGWQRAGNDFFGGGVIYPLHSIPVLSSGPCIPNTQAAGEHALH